jgi:hypothetical protein
MLIFLSQRWIGRSRSWFSLRPRPRPFGDFGPKTAASSAPTERFSVTPSPLLCSVHLACDDLSRGPVVA